MTGIVLRKAFQLELLAGFYLLAQLILSLLSTGDNRLVSLPWARLRAVVDLPKVDWTTRKPALLKRLNLRVKLCAPIEFLRKKLLITCNKHKE